MIDAQKMVEAHEAHQAANAEDAQRAAQAATPARKFPLAGVSPVRPLADPSRTKGNGQ
jgi:hypothetical protein